MNLSLRTEQFVGTRMAPPRPRARSPQTEERKERAARQRARAMERRKRAKEPTLERHTHVDRKTQWWS